MILKENKAVIVEENDKANDEVIVGKENDGATYETK